MKISGALILILGLLLTYYTAVTSVAQPRSGGPGEPEVTMTGVVTGRWQPFIGLGVLVVGCVLLVRGRERT